MWPRSQAHQVSDAEVDLSGKAQRVHGLTLVAKRDFLMKGLGRHHRLSRRPKRVLPGSRMSKLHTQMVQSNVAERKARKLTLATRKLTSAMQTLVARKLTLAIQKLTSLIIRVNMSLIPRNRCMRMNSSNASSMHIPMIQA